MVSIGARAAGLAYSNSSKGLEEMVKDSNRLPLFLFFNLKIFFICLFVCLFIIYLFIYLFIIYLLFFYYFFNLFIYLFI